MVCHTLYIEEWERKSSKCVFTYILHLDFFRSYPSICFFLTVFWLFYNSSFSHCHNCLSHFVSPKKWILINYVWSSWNKILQHAFIRYIIHVLHVKDIVLIKTWRVWDIKIFSKAAGVPENGENVWITAKHFNHHKTNNGFLDSAHRGQLIFMCIWCQKQLRIQNEIDEDRCQHIGFTRNVYRS